ncbi:MAG: hypothetical protein JO032_10820 [Alphaproteobacteria bacterium]|nr:hypothetical protein [Alphaproteobacteria bacterium]
MVASASMLVTSDGNHVLPEDDAFFTTLGGLAPGCDPAEFAVGNLGFVRLRRLDPQTVAVELNPYAVDRRALIGAQLQIGLSAAARFRILYRGAERSAEPPLSAAEAVAALGGLASPPAAASTGRFRLEPCDFARLLRDPRNPLSVLSRKWSQCFGEFSGEVTDFARDNGFLPRMMLVGVPRRRPEPVIRFLGDGFPWLDADFARRAAGRTLDSLPDKEYGAWVGAFYVAVAQRGEPRYDRCVGRLQLGGGRVHELHYERLLLPWQTAAGETVVSLIARRLGDPALPHRGAVH